MTLEFSEILKRFFDARHPLLNGEAKLTYKMLFERAGGRPGTLEEAELKEIAAARGFSVATIRKHLKILKEADLIDFEQAFKGNGKRKPGWYRIFVYLPVPEKRTEKPTPLFDFAQRRKDAEKLPAECGVHGVTALPDTSADSATLRETKEPVWKSREGETLGQTRDRYLREMEAYKAAQNQKISDPLYISIDSIETVDHLTSIEAFQNQEVEVSEQREVKPLQSHGSAKTMQSTFSEMGLAPSAASAPLRETKPQTKQQAKRGQASRTVQDTAQRLQKHGALIRDVRTLLPAKGQEYLAYMVALYVDENLFENWTWIRWHIQQEGKEKIGKFLQGHLKDVGEDTYQRIKALAVEYQQVHSYRVYKDAKRQPAGAR